jgi:ArsR family transcriptional regulator, virulence genes transcriptional regulator
MNLEKLQSNARQASILLKAMSNEHRLLILCRLVEGEKSVGELVRLVGLSQSALSQHLARLRRDSLVRTRRDAQTIYYTVASSEARSLLDRLQDLYCAVPVAEQRDHGRLRRAMAAAHP